MTEPSRAVFLSYASQDAEGAGRICIALRAAGIEVWFDQSELRGGDAWDAVRSEKDKAIEWLERAYHQRDPGILSVTYDPYLDDLREEPRYMALLRGMHLSE